MSNFPSIDLISDVARAADPQKQAAAVRRLSDLAATSATGSEVAIAKIERGPTVAFADFTRNALSPPTSAPARLDSATSPKSAAQKFEAYILQMWLEVLLPKSEEYGGGQAGGTWRSLMAEQLGEQLAKSGGVGVQKILASSESLKNADQTNTVTSSKTPT